MRTSAVHDAVRARRGEIDGAAVAALLLAPPCRDTSHPQAVGEVCARASSRAGV